MQRWFGENKHDMLAYEYYSQAAALDPMPAFIKSPNAILMDMG